MLAALGVRDHPFDRPSIHERAIRTSHSRVARNSRRRVRATIDRPPCRSAFLLAVALPSGVRGPVACCQGFTRWTEFRKA